MIWHGVAWARMTISTWKVSKGGGFTGPAPLLGSISERRWSGRLFVQEIRQRSTLTASLQRSSCICMRIPGLLLWPPVTLAMRMRVLGGFFLAYPYAVRRPRGLTKIYFHQAGQKEHLCTTACLTKRCLYFSSLSCVVDRCRFSISGSRSKTTADYEPFHHRSHSRSPMCEQAQDKSTSRAAKGRAPTLWPVILHFSPE